MELGLNAAKPQAAPRRPQNRSTRAAWWFAQMRQIVSQAVDWDAAPEPRPEQSWLGFSHHRQSA